MTLHLKEGTQSIFSMPGYVVPLAIKAAIGSEIDCLEVTGILERVDCSDWATPIVPVPNKMADSESVGIIKRQ